ncbi:taste receptor type 2 member 40-like [Anomaloglossus baeobatrachus]|uniref:taste receptor type 2 member 40-like n=1 Tax=Anomaloglossus baeobatrachus TaxID=238106 RepID=UPI003F50CCA3
MPGGVWILVLIFGFLATGLGYILNVYILLATAQGLKTGQRLNHPDLIYFVMGLVNIALQSLFCFQGVLSIFFIILISLWKAYVPLTVVTLTLIYFTYWLTAWLCIYYCVTISNFNHPFFLWSKRNISMYLPRLLLLSAAGCFLISLPTIWTASVEVTLQSPVNSTIGPVFTSWTFHFQPLYIHAISCMGCYVPFLFILVSILLTNSSLIRHVRKMRQKDSGLSQTKYQAQMNAIITMCCFLTIAIIFCISEIFFFLLNPNPNNPFTAVNFLILISFPTAESLVIISANPKMKRQIMGKVLRFTRKS